MGGQVSAEGQRQGAWGFLGEGVGAKLLCPDTGAVLTKNHFFGKLHYLLIFLLNVALKFGETLPPVAKVRYIKLF